MIKAFVSSENPRLICETLILEGLPDIPCPVYPHPLGGWGITTQGCSNYYLRQTRKEIFNQWLRSLSSYGVEVDTPEMREAQQKREESARAESIPPGKYKINSIPNSDRVSYSWGHVGEVTIQNGKVSGFIKTAGSHPNNPEYAGKTVWEGTCTVVEFFKTHCSYWHLTQVD